MRIHRDHAGLPAAARGASVAIGNFDGVHRGHREVIRVAARARAGARPPARRGHVRAASARGPGPGDGAGAADAAAAQGRAAAGRSASSICYVCRFDRSLLAASPEAFVDDRCWASSTSRPSPPAATSASATAARAIPAPGTSLERPRSAGDRRRPGDGRTAPSAPRPRSGRRSRMALVEHASALLGYPYQLEGMVRPGDRRGRDARLSHRQRPPARAAARAASRRRLCGRRRLRAGPDGWRWQPAVANLGRAPDLRRPHAAARGPSARGRRRPVRPAAARRLPHRLRGEQTFAGIDELKAQIARDCAQARALHAPIPA